MRRRASSARLGMPLGLSAAVHLALFALAFVARPDPQRAMPPVYRVNLYAAPPGPRQAGVGRPPQAAREAPTPTPSPAPPPAAPETRERDMPLPDTKPIPTRRPQQQATPNPSPTRSTTAGTGKAAETPPAETKAAPRQPEAPTAGGGPEGGRGTDVANVNTPGIDFPYPAYLQNIVRQIALRFEPPERQSGLSATVFFLIRRDGSIDGTRFTKRSGNRAFDVEAMAALEAASRQPGFGPLPDGFGDDVLPVYFNFDPNIIR
jgi:protein TonB